MEIPGWKRLQLQVPVNVWKDQIVLPVDAVVKDGADWYAFQQNGDHFDRIAVHVKHRNQSSVVIDNDGVLFPGDVVALRAAHRLQMALKNKSGGGVDPPPRRAQPLGRNRFMLNAVIRFALQAFLS